MRWSSFLQQALSTTAGAAAAGATATVTLNPVIAVAAAHGAQSATEKLLEEVLSAQQQALEELLERTRGMESLLGEIRSDTNSLVDAPWETANLHIEDAAHHPARAQEKLNVAHDWLLQAMGTANDSAKKALIAQQLCVVSALLGETEDSLRWLLRSYPHATTAAQQDAERFVERVTELPRANAQPPRKWPYDNNLPAGVVSVTPTPLGPFSSARPIWLDTEPVATALTALAETKLAWARLRQSCVVVDAPAGSVAPGVWLDPEEWGILGSVLPGASAMTVHVNAKGYQLTANELLPGAELLHGAVCELAFDLTDSGCTHPGQAFVSGSSAELGVWSPDWAIPLQASEHPGSEHPSDWRRRVHVLNSDEPVEYKYFVVSEPGGSPRWEHGPNRTMPPSQTDRSGNLTRRMREAWRNA